MNLTTDQANFIFEQIEAAGLDMTECALINDDSDENAAAQIIHKPSGSYFTVVENADRYTLTAFVRNRPSWKAEFFNWLSMGEHVRRWAREVKDDVATPDLWANRKREEGGENI